MLILQRDRQQKGLTAVELTVVVVIATLFLAIGFAWGKRALAKHYRVRCTSHLKQLGLGYRTYAVDNHDAFQFEKLLTNGVPSTPITQETIVDCYRTLSNELGSFSVLVCPSDQRKSATRFTDLTSQNISYFIGLNAREENPETVLSGDRNLTTNGVPIGPGLHTLRGTAYLSWTDSMHRRAGQVGLADGSVQQVTKYSLQNMTNYLLVP